MAIILPERPAPRFDGEALKRSPAPLPMLKEAASVLRAARGIGRVEVEGGVLPWVGTAFLVAPRLALTAPHVASARWPSALPRKRGACWINFANSPGTEASDRIRIEAVQLVHPY